MKRITIISLIVFIGLLFACNNTQPNIPDRPTAKVAGPQYQTDKVRKENLSSSLRLPAQLVAYNQVSIFPKVNGYVKNVLVDIGSQVTKGQLLMRLEAPEMDQKSLEAKEKFARANADFSISREHYNRLLVASKTAGAISPLDLSATQAKMKADSALSNAERANWQMEKEMGNYLKVYAPFTGVITERNVDPGSLVNSMAKDGKPMLELKQINKLKLTIDVPESFSGRLKDGDNIQFTVSAIPGQFFTGKVSRKSMNINAQYRVEKTEVDVSNDRQLLKPGMYADVIISLNGNSNAMVVPKSTVVTSTQRKYVLIIRNNIINKVDVTTGNETLDKIEIFGNIQPGDDVIINATDEIAEGKR